MVEIILSVFRLRCIHIIYSLQLKTLRHSIFYNVKYLIGYQQFIVLRKKVVFLNTGSHRKLEHETIETEITASVKFRAVKVSFKKNNIAFFSLNQIHSFP